MRLTLTDEQLERWLREAGVDRAALHSEERALSLQEAATRLGVHPVTLRRWIAAGRLPAVRLGRKWIIRESLVDRLLQRGLDDVDIP